MWYDAVPRGDAVLPMPQQEIPFADAALARLLDRSDGES